MRMIAGFIMIALAVSGGVFAWMKRPIGMRSLENLFATAMEDPNQWVFKEGPFYGVVALLVFLLLAGVWQTVKASKAGR